MTTKQLAAYTLLELLNIALFKLSYIVRLKIKQIRIRLFPQAWSLIGEDLSFLEKCSIKLFSLHCDSDIENIIKDANMNLNGEVLLFSEKYKIQPFSDWLKDPVTHSLWDGTIFSMKAPVKQRGLSDVKYVLELNKFNHLVRVALAYYHSHNTCYTDFICKSIKGWRKTVTPYKSVVNRIMMDKGFRIINLIQILLLCHKDTNFLKEVAPLINGIIKDEVEAIMEFHTAKWFKTGNGLNHVTGEMVGVLIGQMWLEYCEIKSYKSSYKKEMKYLLEVLDRTIAPSGSYLEQSDNYARVVAEFLLAFDLFRNTFAPAEFPDKEYNEKKYTERLLQYLKALNYHDQLPNVGDNDDARVLIAFKKANENIDYVTQFCKETNLNRNRSYLDGSSWIFRSKDKNDIFLFTRVGRHSYVRESAGSHAHNDILSVIWGMRGQMIFVDKGCRFYNAGDLIRKEDRQYSAHNTVSVNGIEINQLIPKGWYFDYPKSKCLSSTIDVKNAFFEGSLDYYGIHQTRKICYNDSTILIQDDLTDDAGLNRTGKIRFLLHQDIVAEEMNNFILLTSKTNKNVNAQMRIDGAEKVEIVPATYAPSFAHEVNSFSIVASFSFSSSINLTTTIYIID